MIDGTYTGVIDRIVDGTTAVIILEEDGEPIEQLDVPVEGLPEPARKDGGVLSVSVVDGEFAGAEYRPEETQTRREAARERLDRLSEPLSDRDE